MEYSKIYMKYRKYYIKAQQYIFFIKYKKVHYFKNMHVYLNKKGMKLYEKNIDGII